ncbi:MAG: ribonuclease HI [Gemmatimonadetes bacterium]|nr:ribonuclease HI [Gemmatimonadota bacterium]NIR78103.1 ribonuclease HI [Gemmatimonadota bacterium]NIT86670.1 ribonuclease HI [Gemmatimonadota bacterium]NIU30523.1 ribonuclease HI [Gemmatimonadota bacterium]NIU35362.1 ribonuclease HI [Gemmatimonadota bacterium]
MSAPDEVYVNADESCLGNQFRGRANPGGAAGVLEVWKGERWHRRDYWISSGDTTNNRMAIRSAIVPLRLLTRPCTVVFISDSQYLVKGMREWVEGWKARGWKRKEGAIENLELWQTLDRVADRHEIEWRWVRGHAGHPQNEYANDLAIRAAKGGTDSNGFVDSGFVEWLNEQRDRYEKYLDFFEFLPPEELHPPEEDES